MKNDNLQLVAFRKTAGYMAIVTAIASVLLWLTFVIPLEFILWGFIIGMVVLSFSLMYSVILNDLKLQHEMEKRDIR